MGFGQRFVGCTRMYVWHGALATTSCLLVLTHDLGRTVPVPGDDGVGGDSLT